MNNRAVFGEINQAKLDSLQKKEDYTACYELYQQSNIDSNNPDTRNIKLTLYKILADYMMYDPVIENTLSFTGINPDFSVFSSVSKDDPQYVNKMKAILMVLYYCLKNRCYNYALQANASHDEISKGEYLRDWLENNADKIINGHTELNALFSSVMVLLYDKVLGATVELVHSGKDVPTSVSTFNVGSSFAFSEINYANTTKVQKINALKLKGMSDYRDNYIERRNFWKENTLLPASKNFFLFGIYDIKEINAFLQQFNFKLFDISTKYYENYFCHFVNPFTLTIVPLKRILYLLTDNEKKMNELTKKHREWPFSLLVKSFLKTFTIAIAVAVIAVLIFMPLGENVAMVLAIFSALVFFAPPFNRMREKKKRKKYSILK